MKSYSLENSLRESIFREDLILYNCLQLSTLLEVDSANMSVLEVDAFGLLVAFTFSLPSLFNEHQGPHSTDIWHLG